MTTHLVGAKGASSSLTLTRDRHFDMLPHERSMCRDEADVGYACGGEKALARVRYAASLARQPLV